VRRFELSEGGSHKFWQIEVTGDSFTVTYGRIGTAGQAQTKAFADAATAEKEAEKLVREKVKKGYAEVGAPAAAAESAPAVAAAPPAPAAPRPPKPKAEPVPVGDGFVPAEGGYSLGIAEGRVVARSPQGKLLASLPKAVKDSPVLTRLEEALEQLEAHEARCAAEVEAWMLRALPVPRAVLESVAQDPAWWGRIQHLVAQAPDGSAGIVRAVDPARGVGVVDLDGETRWLAAASLTFPHPVTLDELDDWRSLLLELGLSQGTPQLLRETFARTAEDDGNRVGRFSGAEFEPLAVAINEARKLGLRVRGGCAVARVWESGRPIEARYEIGEGDPAYGGWSGDLVFVDAQQRQLPLADVGPVAFSEGVRMASAIWAKRTVAEASND
jgi:predicted DNA-binding WGR domain protein